ncbi:N-acetylneuraminate synthase family protein, partial [Patescibacteria group bacterium]|nr:N-acetylneuraminate synthase family protein [Patescibacteria group bacterium]
FGTDGFKIHSSDITNEELLKFIEKTKKPILLSCAGSNLNEINNAIEILKKSSKGTNITLMHGFQCFPTHINDINLQRMKSFQDFFGLDVGYSDHVSGDSPLASYLPLIALGLGAVVIEKHITSDRSLKETDYQSALNPDEFFNFVSIIRKSFKSLGSKSFDMPTSESKYRHLVKKFPVSKINLDKVVKYLNKHKIINFQFNFENWNKQFADRAKILLQHGWISQEDSNKANELLKYGFKKSKLIFSNGDYYPKNLLNFKGKIMVIDWETWNTNYRANIVDYIENVVAFTFIHMWNNRLWQIEFLKEVRKYFRIDFRDLRNAILIKSFEQIFFFGGESRRGKKQLIIFKNILSDFYVKCLERNTRPSIRYRIFKKCHLR